MTDDKFRELLLKILVVIAAQIGVLAAKSRKDQEALSQLIEDLLGRVQEAIEEDA